LILLDTHIWVRWLLPDDPLPPSLPQRIEAADSVAVCTISCWEIGMLVQRGRLSLPLSVSAWVEEATDGSGVEVLPLDCVPAHAAAALPEHHRDPADRLIIATALHLEATLISLDERFPAYFDASPGKAQLVQA
jgi:PIN domain nuclease of toxin-antitoxin system